MRVDEFLVWAEGRPGRYELNAGEIVAMSPQRARHADAKFAVQTTLKSAIRRGALPCRMCLDGTTVQIDHETAYEPDALVCCGGGDLIETHIVASGALRLDPPGLDLALADLSEDDDPA
ncbi:Uma2 family endonuclease [Methylobacterium radiodurans]|nr:Uma2 family endonuclease [Methylobacterium radiodurans]